MKALEYTVRGNDIVLFEPNFDLAQTLDCGQAFRWVSDGDGYRGAFLNTPLYITQRGDEFTLHDTSKERFLDTWADYFDLYTDYGEIKRTLSRDKTLAAATAYAPGIRLLRQDSWEALCSFIISQNNNIPRIKGIISRLCEAFGGFPSAKELSEKSPEELRFLRAGFRAGYITDAAKKAAGGEVDFEMIGKAPIDKARQRLMTIRGVGPKVAECALLYGMYRTEAFPIDVWIKRVMNEFYPSGLPKCTKGIEGIAQQYLFHYIRTGLNH